MFFEKFSLVHTQDNDIGFIVSTIMDIPYIHDGCGTGNANTPCLFKPDDFDTFQGYIVYTMPEGEYKIFADHSLRKFDLDCPYDQTAMFDHATSGMRFHLSMLELLKQHTNKFKLPTAKD